VSTPPTVEAPAEQRTGTPRRGFFQALAAIGSGAATALLGSKVLASRQAEAAPIPPVVTEPAGNLLVRMQQDLEASMRSGRTPSWIMVVDTRKCIGCDACTIACKAENLTGPAGGFRRVIKKEFPIGPRPWAIYKPANCLQCDDPPCAKAVPKGMINKRPDGIVELDTVNLRGQWAQTAAKACPFNALHVDDGKTFTQDTPKPQAYELRPFIENGAVFTHRPGANQLAQLGRKCTFCSHLLEVGVLPACVTTCIGGAMYFGDANVPGSLVNEITGGRRIFQGHQNRGVKPRVIYFEESMPGAPHIDCAACHS